MKSSLSFLVLVSCTTLAWPQAVPPQTATPAPPSAPTSVKPRGPEAVADRDPTRVVATINGKQLTAKEAADLLKAFPPEQRKQYQLSTLVEEVYKREQFAQEAKKLNLDQQVPWKDQLEFTRNNVLSQAYLSHLGETAAKSATEDPQKYYNEHPNDFDKVKLSGIFVGFSAPGTPAANAPGGGRTSEQALERANDIEKKLKSGGNFTEIARTDSDNQASATKGGDLGTYNTGDPQIPADIKGAIAKLDAGNISEPVRIPNGYLIVKLDSRTKVAFDQARAGIVQQMETEKSQAAVKQELEKYKIQVQDPDFFNAGGATSNIPSLQRPGTPAAQASPK